jgi:signal transduction histidine kinase
MKDRATRYARPALWGFFICIIIAGILAIVRFFIPSFVTNRWSSERSAWSLQTMQIVRESFQNHVEQLTRIAERVSQDTLLYRNNSRGDVSAAIDAFNILNLYQLNDNQTIELIDSSGNVLAWNGSSITSDYAGMLGKNLSRRFVRVSQNGLRTYLIVGISIPQNKLYLMASEELELNSPLSNRFVQKVSLSEDLSQKLKAQVTLRLPQIYIPRQGEIVVPVVDNEGKTIAEFCVTEKSLDSVILSVDEMSMKLIAFFLAFGCLFLAGTGSFWIAGKRGVWSKILVNILLLWFLRLAWYKLKFPNDFIGGWLFDPSLYASPFAFGLISSLGDLIISVLIVVISSWIFFVGIYSNRDIKEVISKISYRLGRAGVIISVSVIILLILWLFRGFSEAIRSFVFDSTIQYNNPSEILLNNTAALMQLNIFLLGAALLCISITLVWIGRQVIFIQYPSSGWRTQIVLIFPLLFCIILFVLLDETPLKLLLSAILLITLSIIFVGLLVKWNNEEVELFRQRRRIVICIILSSYFISVPVLHQRLELKELRNVEAKASEFLRPSDSWLTHVVLDGLHTSADNLMNELTTNQFKNSKESSISFLLWTKTLLGKEGYNSALVLYDYRGNEIDRFVVGMSKQEQREILTSVFEGEEDAVHILGQAEPKALGKLYGAWITVRDSRGQVVGSIAILLSEHQRNIFQEQETEPLKQFSDRLENSEVREIAVHEYRRDSLVFSTGRKLFPNQSLFQIGGMEILKARNNIIWKDIIVNGYETQTLFIQDASSPERIVAISLEMLDFRWELFEYLKEFFICLAILALVGMYIFFWSRIRGATPTIGFRGKLFLGFACIVLLSLAILSYYNRQLVAERVKEQLEKTLYHQLIQLQDRISTYISDEEDFVRGVDDDFCEALTSEYDIDFSVYRNASVQASSRSELYRADLLDKRLNAKAFVSAMLGGKGYVLSNEKIGSVEYVVGYAPISLAGKVIGVVAIPTLNRQKEIESELAQRNAYVFGAYAIVFGIALVCGGLLTLRFTKPLNQLTLAAKDISRGNLDVELEVKSQDEIGVLVQSFNEMASKLRTSRVELAKHERESAWKEMAKQVAHEIRNPLTPIKLSIQHLRQAFKDKAPDRNEILQRVTLTIIDQIEALSRIATEFSRFAKMPESKYERLSIDDLLKETINLFREVNGINFIDRLATPSVMIVADRDQLRGVFINIIRNAIQAINGEGAITIETSVDKRICIVRISDTGSGISDETLAKIFEPNFSTKTEGLGLGLAIARRVIEDHGGTIFCSSKGSEGTTFEIRLPI